MTTTPTPAERADGSHPMSGERIETAGEYTPTTDEVRAVWMEWSEYGGLTNRPASTDRTGMVAEFDRWLAQVAAEQTGDDR